MRVLDLGADDHLNKPFEQPVLVARVRAAFRRVARLAA
jgi:DNA-binding response OmpR family regulator